ncbi:MAG: FAD-binding oxidoreductase [Paracoccaceae bacterium]
MKRIYENHAYGDGPIKACFWNTTVAERPARRRVEGAVRAEVAIIGGGFTGLSAALHLAEAGVDVALVEAQDIGWGASGRNGGFCCLGGAKASEATIARRFGDDGLAGWYRAQRDAVDLVASLLDRHEIAADTHSNGEAVLAHRARDWKAMKAEAEALYRAYGQRPELVSRDELASHGLSGPGFHGASILPIGFALNPLKYVLGLARAAEDRGARLFVRSPVEAIRPDRGGYALDFAGGRIDARSLILATNGYSSEDIPPWMRSRYLPVQSSVMVTRPLSRTEIEAQGWWSDLMAYDTRNLLHYFRLMPDRRFLFGMRGGISGDEASGQAIQRHLRRDFDAMFPAWAQVETPHMWSGLVCLARDLMPHVGPIGDWGNAFAGFAWHGNGVAMGSYAGKLLAGLVTGQGRVPDAMAARPARFPLGRFRRALLHPAYAWYGLRDRG